MAVDKILMVEVNECAAPLTWEIKFENEQIAQRDHPERKTWSDFLYKEISKNYQTFLGASDLTTIIPEPSRYSQRQIVTLIAELFCGIALYESTWDPTCASTDVNGSDQPKDEASGLFQMNEADQNSFHTGTHYDFRELRTALPNIEAGVGIMVNQIKKYNKFIISKGEKGIFWAVLHPGGKYDKTNKILRLVWNMASEFSSAKFAYGLSFSGFKEPQPWVKWFMERLGMNEANPDDVFELSKGWKYTNVPSYDTIVGGKYAWCGMSLATALAKNGYKYPEYAEAAYSYVDYGTKCELKPGAIVVIQHANKNHHVTTFVEWADQSSSMAKFLGGNQDDAIEVKDYDVSGNKNGQDEIIAIRWPVRA